MAKFCPKCGTELNDDAIFCSLCGCKLQTEENKFNNTVNDKEYDIKTDKYIQEPTVEKNLDNLNNDEIYITDKSFFDMFFKKDGRLNRWRYFKRMLLIYVIRLIIVMALFIVISDDFGNTTTAEDVFITIVSLSFLIPEYFLTVRRFQDLGVKDLSWAYWLVGVDALFIVFGNSMLNTNSTIKEFKSYFILIVYFCMFLYLLFKKGTTGNNQYGADPLGNTDKNK